MMMSDLNLLMLMSQNGQTQFKNRAPDAAEECLTILRHFALKG